MKIVLRNKSKLKKFYGVIFNMKKKHIKTISSCKMIKNKKRCGECQTSCQSACKTSCTVANQNCENN